MKKLETVIAQLETAGLTFEVEYPQSVVKYHWDKDSINIDNSVTITEARVGIEVQAHVWAWFNYMSTVDYFSFCQRYNRNTGGIIRTWKTGYNIALKLKEKYNVDIR